MKLIVESRQAKSKSEINKIRHEGNIPAVLYRRGKSNIYLTVKGNQFLSTYREIPQGGLPTSIFEMEIDGKPRRTVIKEIQYHPTTYQVIHLDFMQLEEDEHINVNVPIRCVGVEECVGIKLGGFLRQVIRHIKVRCLPKDLPKEFFVDIHDLKIRGTKRVKDLEMPAGVTPLLHKENVLAVIAKR